MKLFSLHGRQRCRCHVSAELLPCNRAAAASSAAASKGERMPRLSASEPVPPCKALGDEGNLLPRQGRQHRALCRPGSAAGLQASQDGSESCGRLRRGLRGLRWARGTRMLLHPEAAGSTCDGQAPPPPRARNRAPALPGASGGQQRCNPRGTQVPPALRPPGQEKGLGAVAPARPLLLGIPGAGVGTGRGCEAPRAVRCAYLRETPCAGRSRRRAGSGPQPSTGARPPPPARSCWVSSDLQAQRERERGQAG